MAETVSILVDRIASVLGHGCALRGHEVPATLAGWHEAAGKAAERTIAANKAAKMPFGSVVWISSPVEGEEIFAVEHTTASGRLQICAAERADGSGEVVLTSWAGPRWFQRPHESEGALEEESVGAIRLNGLYFFDGGYYAARWVWPQDGAARATFVHPNQVDSENPDGVFSLELGDLLQRGPGGREEKIGGVDDLVDTGVTLPPRYRPPVAAPEPVAKVTVKIRPGGGYNGGGLFEAIEPALVAEKPERILLMGETCRKARLPLAWQAEQAFRAAEAAVWARQAADAALLAALKPPSG